METKTLLALARECILNPNTQPIQEFNDVLEDNEVPRIDRQEMWILKYNDKDFPMWTFTSLELLRAAVNKEWLSGNDPDAPDEEYKIIERFNSPSMIFFHLVHDDAMQHTLQLLKAVKCFLNPHRLVIKYGN